MSTAPMHSKTPAAASAVQDDSRVERGSLHLSRQERVIAWFLPSLGDVVFVCALLIGLVGLQGRILGVDGDAGWNIALGTYILHHGLPRVEPFLSGMIGQPTVHWEWGAQVIYALGYQFGGLNGVVAIASALLASVLLGLYAILRRHGASPLVAVALTLLGAAPIAMAWTARAEVFSLLFTLAWAEWLWRYWRDGARWRLWVFPVLTALWTNIHAGWMAGIALLGIATVVALFTPPGRRAAEPRWLVAALGGSLLATLINPWGIGYWQHVITFALNPLIARYTQEYQSPDFHLGPLWLFMLLIGLLVATWLWATRDWRAVAPLGLAICCVWTALSLVYVRFVPLWPLICMPHLVDALPAQELPGLNVERGANDWRVALLARAGRMVQALGRVSRRTGEVERVTGRGVWPLGALLLVALVVANGGAVPGRSAPLLHAQWDARAFPVAAVARLKREGLPSGQGYNPYEWGGYLDVALPGYHVFIDSRSDVYSRHFLEDYMRVTDLAPGWNRLLDSYHIQWALVQSDAPLAQGLALSGWRCAPEDSAGVATLCVRPSHPTTARQAAVSARDALLEETALTALNGRWRRAGDMASQEHAE